MFIDNIDDANVINFEEQEQDVSSYTYQQHKFPNIQSDDYRPSSPPKVTVNREFHKNLGQNQAQYADDRKFDVNKIRIESTQQNYKRAEVVDQNQSDNEDYESVIQFNEIAEKEENEQHEDQQLGESKIQNNDQLVNQVAPSIQNSIVSNTSAISAYPKVNNTLEFELTKEFLTSPLQGNGIVQCQFVVNTSGLNALKPKIYLQKDGKIFLAAKKSSNKFVISMNKDKIQRSSSSFIGLVQCEQKYNYYFYDNGFAPKKHKLPTRISIGTVKFIIPPKTTEPRQQEFRFPDNEIDIYMNRKPKWNEKTKSFTLNFYDRVKISSIKNFQLIKLKEQVEQIFVQFGKENDQIFNLDFQAPFSPLQAFMLALANYDKKIEY